MSIVCEETAWWFNRKVIDFSRYRMYNHFCKFVNGFTYNMTATCGFESDVVQMNISEGMTETLVYARLLMCHETKTMYIVRVQGRRWYGGMMGVPLEFTENDMIDDVREDVWHCFAFMFQDVCLHVRYYDKELFEQDKTAYAKTLCCAASVLPFRGSVLTNIAKYMRPYWFDFNYSDSNYDLDINAYGKEDEIKVDDRKTIV